MTFQGQYIYERGSKNGKRVQSNMGAKNHGVIMPDANKESTINQVRIIFGLFLVALSTVAVTVDGGGVRSGWSALHGADNCCVRRRVEEMAARACCEGQAAENQCW
jgi:hypothetical protein